MVVDDNPDITHFIETCLKTNGYAVDTYNIPKDAIKKFRRSYYDYDLVLLAIRMDSMNGFELFTKMKEIDYSINVCFMTDFKQYYDFLCENYKLDVKCFIGKPINEKSFLKIIKNKLNNQSRLNSSHSQRNNIF